MNELALYQLFRNILAASTVMEGRFFIVRQAASEINVSNMSSVIADVLDSQTIQKKYPCVVMLPPTETGYSMDNAYNTMRIDLYFLTLEGRTGDGDVKSPDLETNRSQHTREEDWKDMRECAGGFVAKLKELTRVPPLSQHLCMGTSQEYKRMTNRGSDGLNGVYLSFDMMMRQEVCSTAEYPAGTVIAIPTDFVPHETHKH